MGERVYTVRFEGDEITTTVTTSGEAVEEWINEIYSVRRRRLHELVIGLDVEWRTLFGPGYSRTALLQLCVGRRCLIFQILHADYIPNALGNFLGHPDFRFVGVGVRDDAVRLSNDYGLDVASTVDLAELAEEKMGRSDLRHAGLKAIASVVMGATIDKPQRVRTGRWDAYELSGEQIQYACIDAFVSFEVGRKLLTGDYERDETDPMGETRVRAVTFGGDTITTTVTSSGEAVEGWLHEVLSVHRRRLHKLIVGLDVEWRPSYSRAYSPTALLQLCVGRRCLVFQLLHADYIPDALAEFLDDPDYRFVGVGVRDDAERLSNDQDLAVSNTVDLAELAAQEMGLRNAGLKALASAVMGVTVEKPKRVRKGHWDAYELSDQQIKYACIDAFVSFEVGRKLLTGDY